MEDAKGSAVLPEAQETSQDPAKWLCAFCREHPVFSLCVISLASLVLYLLVIGVALQNKRKKGNALLFHGRFLLYYGIMSFASIAFAVIFPLRPKNVVNALMTSPVATFISFLLGVKWEMRGGEFLDELAGRSGKGGGPKGVVLIGNHQSTLDSLGLMHFWPRFHPMAAVIKKEVFFVWPFGLAAYFAGSIYVDRSRGKTAFYSIEASAQRAAKENIKMFVFPEGTRNRANLNWTGDDDSKQGLLPFKTGAFRAAISSGVPIVPVVFSPYVFVDEKRHLFGRGKAIVKVLPEIPTTGLTTDDIPAVMESAHKVMSEEYRSLRKELLSEIPPDHFVISKKAK
ncbi:1-acyl-sn-glycerol-3-phosphate acyltransferase beta-like [Ischnura elegans]|uniref:1-acyl-sn-glycerol-3-phosphate acyltransferase beta-like n=1 Tax=Ischnura elegans TaxID=197161 RepID=UPI001ED86636|nr:1-acyl-sn-glycerol-3-phosphate acyltransferase beta-like [Ischnura elegans]